MIHPRIFPFLVLLTLLLAGCSLFQPAPKPEDKNAKSPPRLVGRIASIPADRRFVLIQSYGSWEVETGTVLTTRGADERTANLRVTGEKLGQFAAADIQSGQAEVGDSVYTCHVPKPVTPTETVADSTQPIENQQNPGTEDVQKNN